MSCFSEIKASLEQKFSGSCWEKPAKLCTHPMFWVLLVVYGLFFWSSSLIYTLPADTYQYISYDENIFRGETDDTRTPLYPYILQGVRFVTGEKTMRLNYNGGNTVPRVFVEGLFAAQCTVGLQMLAFAVALCLFYDGVGKILSHQGLRIALVLFTGIALVNYPRWVSTESFAISMVMVFFWLMMCYLFSPKTGTAIAMGIWVFLMTMLRPIFVYVMFLLFLFWVVRLILSPARKTALAGLLSICAMWGLLLGYCHLNYVNYGINGITMLNTFNQLSKIVRIGFYDRGPNPEINEFIKSQNPDRDADNQGDLYQKLLERWSYRDVQRYTVGTFTKQPFDYGITCIKYMWWEGYKRFWHFCYFLGVVDLLFCLFLWFKTRRFPWVRLFCWGLFYGIVAAVYLDIACDYERLVAPCLPIAYLIAARYIDLLFMASERSKAEVGEFIQKTI